MTDKTLIHINLASGFGGGEVQTLNLIQHITGYRQLIVCKKGSEFQRKAAEAFAGNPSIQVVSGWRAMLAAFTGKKVLIHAHDGRGAHLARIIAALSGSKYVISRRVDKPLKGSLSQGTYRSASAVIGVSHKVANNLVALNPHVSVIHDSYSNLPASPSVTERLHALEDKFVVTQLGSLLEIKNVPFTLSLAKALESSHPEIHFLIVGEGKEEVALKQQAEGLANVTFFGFTPYVASILDRTNLLCMPSKSEGLGSAVLEAYQHDTPVLTSNVGGLPEIVVDGETGFLFELDDLALAQQRLLQLATDNALYAGLQQNIRESKQQYSPESMAASYMACYDKV